MRIARILTRLNLGGPARQVLAGDPELARRGVLVRVFAGSPEPGEGDLGAELERAGIDWVRVPGLQRCPNPLADRRASAFLRRELAAFGPDLVHTHASKAGWIGRRAAREATPGAALVYTFHGHVLEGYFSRPISQRLQRTERRLARRTDRLIAVSEATRDDLVRLGIAAADKIELVPPGARLERLLELPEAAGCGALRASLGIDSGARVVLMLGRLAPVKQPRLGLRVFERVAAVRGDVHLLFVGDGDREARALDRAIARLGRGIRERVHRLGNLSDMPALFAEVDVLLQTSSSEGFPVALIEAQAAARPFVATAVGGVPEVARSGGGITVEAQSNHSAPQTEEALAEALLPLVADSKRCMTLGRLGRRAAARDSTGRSLAGRLHGVYERVLMERTAGVA